MLDGLEVAEVRFKDTFKANETFRVDAEFYRKEFLQNDFEDLQTFSFRDICSIKSGTTPIDRDDELTEGIVLLKTTDIRNNVLSKENIDDFYFISHNIAKRMQETSLRSEDVLINIVGATTEVIGRTAFVPDDFPQANITQAMAFLRLIDKKIRPAYLFSFLSGKYGNKQVRRFARPTGQFNLNLQEVGKFQIPFLNIDFQKQIEKTVKSAHTKLEQSKQLYAEAEETLLEELGLKNWHPPKESVTVKTFKESFGKSGRLDAEYYQPKYDALLRSINKTGFPIEKLGSLVKPIKNGFDSREYTEEGTPYIRVGDVKNGHIDIEGAVKIPVENSEVDKDVSLNLGDVLFTRKGSFGNAAVVREDTLHTIISSEIMLLRLLPEKNKTILPDYLALYLNSQLGFMQVERRVHGVAYYSISQPDLATIEIALPSKSVQTRIEKKVQDSLSALKESKRLLELAKQAVETAIEKGEKAGLKVLA